MITIYCCPQMKQHRTAHCEEHGDRCADYVIREYKHGVGIPIHDGGSSYVEINFCPWCGRSLK